MGLYPLQRTVWFIRLILGRKGFASAYYKVERFVTVMEVVSLDPEDLKNYKSILKKKGYLICFYCALFYILVDIHQNVK